MSRREENRQRTLPALSRAALELFDERGYDSVTVEDIAQAAGVSRRTFFRYYDSKEAALFGPMEDRLAAFEAAVQAQLERCSPAEALTTVFLAWAGNHAGQREQSQRERRVIDSSSRLTAYELTMDRRWEEMAARALVDPDAPRVERLRARVTAAAYVAMARTVLMEWLEEDFDLLELAHYSVDQRHAGTLFGVLGRLAEARPSD